VGKVAEPDDHVWLRVTPMMTAATTMSAATRTTQIVMLRFTGV
jgi:hypothetical protein